MTPTNLRRLLPLLALRLACLAAVLAPAPAAAMQILDAADHAELAAEISATDVNRIALAGDRIAKVVRAPDGFAVEHDAGSGDLYLRAANPDRFQSASTAPGSGVTAPAAGNPVTLFVGTEKGFTYRLTLTPAQRGSAQILIRNPDIVPAGADVGPVAGGPHIAALVRLLRAVARREPLPGYAIEAGGPAHAGLTLIETWRGPRFAALVFEAAGPAVPGSWGAGGAGEDADGAAGLAGTIGETLDAGRVAALWLAPPGAGPSGGRLAVAIVDPVATGAPR